MKLWKILNQYLLWLTLFVLPWQTRYLIKPVYFEDSFVEYASTSVYLTDLLIITLLIIWLPLLIWERKFKIGPKFLFWSLAVFITWMWVSVTWASSINADCWLSVWTAAKFTLFSFFYLYLINNVKNLRDLALPIGWGVAFQGVLALGQYFSNSSLGLKWIGESVLDPKISGIPVVIVEGIRQLRAHGSLPHANILGGFLAVALIILSAGFYSLKKYWWHYFILGACILGGWGLLLSFSRSAWLVYLLAVLLLGIWIWFRRPKRFKAAIFYNLLIALAIAVLAIGQYKAVIPRFDFNQPLEQISVTSRLQQWSDFKTTYSKYPILGIGIGQYIPYLQELNKENQGWHYRSDLMGWVYNSDNETGMYEPVHNIFLLILIELGIVGLIIFISIIVSALCLVANTVRYRPLLGGTILLAWSSILLLGMIDHYIWTLQQGRLLWFVVLALIVIVSLRSGYNKKVNKVI